MLLVVAKDVILSAGGAWNCTSLSREGSLWGGPGMKFCGPYSSGPNCASLSRPSPQGAFAPEPISSKGRITAQHDIRPVVDKTVRQRKVRPHRWRLYLQLLRHQLAVVVRVSPHQFHPLLPPEVELDFVLLGEADSPVDLLPVL